MSGRETFYRLRKVILLLSWCLRWLPLVVRKFLWRISSNCTGNLGIGLRYVLLRAIASECGDNVAVHQSCHIFFPERLSVGNNVSIHPMSYIDASGGISIGSNVSIAHGVTILSSSHTYETPDIPIKYQPLEYMSTNIEDDSWLGCKAVILGGVNIGRRTIIGACALVNGDVQSNTLVGGVPARVLKSLK